MRVVIDSNVFIESVPATSRYHTIFRALLDKKFELAVSTETLNDSEKHCIMNDKKNLFVVDANIILVALLSS